MFIIHKNVSFAVFTEPEKSLGKTLEEQLTACKDTEPAIGEFWSIVEQGELLKIFNTDQISYPILGMPT